MGMINRVDHLFVTFFFIQAQKFCVVEQTFFKFFNISRRWIFSNGKEIIFVGFRIIAKLS